MRSYEQGGSRGGGSLLVGALLVLFGFAVDGPVLVILGLALAIPGLIAVLLVGREPVDSPRRPWHDRP